MIAEYHDFDEASAEETQFKGNRFILMMVILSINLGGGFKCIISFTPIFSIYPIFLAHVFQMGGSFKTTNQSDAWTASLQFLEGAIFFSFPPGSVWLVKNNICMLEHSKRRSWISRTS